MTRHIRPHSARRDSGRRRPTVVLRALGTGLLLAVGLHAGAPAARAQTTWELTGYEIPLVFAVESSPRLSPRAVQRLQHSLMARVESSIGAAWNMRLTAAAPELQAKALAGLDALTVEDLSEELLDSADKVMFVTLRDEQGAFAVAAREFDVRTRQWGTIARQSTAQAGALADETFRTLWLAFSPLAQIEEAEGKTATLRLRAAALGPIDGTLEQAYLKQPWRAVIRYSDRDGRLRKTKYVDWTWLLTDRVEGSLIHCSVYSGMRSPLSERRRGRIEKLALAVRPPRKSSRLELIDAKDKNKRFSGYDILTYSPDSKTTTKLGRTDRQGGIVIPPAEEIIAAAPPADPPATGDAEAAAAAAVSPPPAYQPLRMVLIMSSSAALARVPVLPGVEPLLLAEVPDDRQRLEVEGFIIGVQEQLVDTVSKRAFLLARAEENIAKSDRPAAQSVLDEARKLKSRQSFAYELQQEQQRLGTLDPRTQKRVEKLLDDTRQAVTRFLDPAEFDKIEQRYLLMSRAQEQASQ